jgi:hypothetical protein
VLYCHADSTGPDVIEQNIAYFNDLERRVVQAVPAYGHTPTHDDADLENLIGFPFDDVLGTDQLNDEDRAFYRPAHHAAIKAMLEWAQKMAN